jgi:predicted transcriptional regulator of viral defense system
MLALVHRLAVVRARDLVGQDVPRAILARLVAEGVLDRPSRGMYVLAYADITESHDLAQACKWVPHGVVCLLSALRFQLLW